MSNAVDGLEPHRVWQHFAALARIPRGSANEEGAARYVLEAAGRLGLAARRDSVGNVFVRVPASPGRERSPSLCLQGHLDMVCEKNRDTAHDFEKDPIELIRSDGLVRANGTTLGADNGIGVAAALAVMEDRDVEHGPLELLFTVEEETGLTGASNIDPAFLESRTLLNLDSEEEGSLYVGCSGGKDTVAELALALEPAPAGAVALEVVVRGLRGGHSGLDIDKGRGNAIKILNRALLGLSELGARLAALQGGSKRNAIAREAQALVFVPKAKLALAEAYVRELAAVVKAELGGVEADVAVSAAVQKGKRAKVLKAAQQKKLLWCLAAMPHGIIRMSTDLPGLVETSTNLAIVELRKDVVVVATSQRSAVASAKEEIALAVVSCFRLAGFEVNPGAGYPGWKPNLGSPVLQQARSTYRDLFGAEPAVKAIHAGLECGIIGEKLAGIDMVSFGPTIENAHSPDERVVIESVERFWRFLREMLKRLA